EASLNRRRGFLDLNHAFDVPGEIIAREFDLEIREAVILDPLTEVFRQPIADWRFDICWKKWIERPDEVIERQPRLGLRMRVLVQVLPLKVAIEKVRKVAVHVLARQPRVTAHAVDAPVGIENRRLQRARGD